MKLVHPDLERQITIQEGTICEWIIELPAVFSKYVEELYFQAEGKDGRFVLSEGDKEIDIAKYVEVIVNPFAVNINDKKILNKLYAELMQIAYGEDVYQATLKIQGELQSYFLQIEQECAYMLEMGREEIDMLSIFKAMDVKLESYAENFWENINQYIKIQAELMKRKLIVLVNISSYISKEQMTELVQTALYHEMFILFVENKQVDFSKEIQSYIIDCDRCEI